MKAWPLELAFERDAARRDRFVVTSDDAADTFDVVFDAPPLGLELRIVGGFAVVNSVAPGSRAASRVERGDLIIAANGTPVDASVGLAAVLAALGDGVTGRYPLTLTLERSATFRARFVEALSLARASRRRA